MPTTWGTSDEFSHSTRSALPVRMPMFVQARTVTSARKHDMRLRHGFDAIGAPRPSKTRCVNIATPYLILIKNVDDTTVVRAAAAAAADAAAAVAASTAGAGAAAAVLAAATVTAAAAAAAAEVAAAAQLLQPPAATTAATSAPAAASRSWTPTARRCWPRSRQQTKPSIATSDKLQLSEHKLCLVLLVYVCIKLTRSLQSMLMAECEGWLVLR